MLGVIFYASQWVRSSSQVSEARIYKRYHNQLIKG